MIEKLPHIYLKEKAGNIYKVLKIIKDELEVVNNSRKEVKEQDEINKATGETLNKHGEIVGQERGTFNDEIYRILIKSRIEQNLSGGDINSIIEFIATLLNIDFEQIKITESHWGTFKFSDTDGEVQTSSYEGFDTGTLSEDNYEPAYYEFNVDPGALNDIGFPIQDLVYIVKGLSAAGVRINFYIEGTFAFSSTNGEIEYSEETGFNHGELGAYYNPDEGFFS